MAKYSVILSSRVEAQLLQHMEFLARVSVPAAKRFREEYARILDRLEDNPHQFPVETDPNLPTGLYRKALFAKRYKALFSIVEDLVYLDAVVDCRQQNEMLDS
jgi:plasmid stabilization system protein ParE